MKKQMDFEPDTHQDKERKIRHKRKKIQYGICCFVTLVTSAAEADLNTLPGEPGDLGPNVSSVRGGGRFKSGASPGSGVELIAQSTWLAVVA